MDQRLISALAAAAESLHASARSHKRAADMHKREARKQMKTLDLLTREAERLGIRLEITQTPGRESQ